jgi:hypothetical protein
LYGVIAAGVTTMPAVLTTVLFAEAIAADLKEGLADLRGLAAGRGRSFITV